MPYADPSKIKEYSKRYCERNAERARKRAADWRKAHPEQTAAMNAKWNRLRARPKPKRIIDPVEQRKKDAIRARDWRMKNRERVNAISRRSKSKNRAAATALQAKRKSQQQKSIPRWASLPAIREFYIRAAVLGKTVDHIVPLQSRLVCGLHCEANLCLLPADENASKGNRYWPNMP